VGLVTSVGAKKRGENRSSLHFGNSLVIDFFFFWLEKYCPRNSGVKNDNGTNGWVGEGPMDITCDRPAVMHMSAVVCFGRY